MKLTRAEAARWLQSHHNYCILTHRRPDGDTLGCAAALCLALRSIGKRAFVLENPEVTKKYSYLHTGLTCQVPEPEATLVCVDVAAPNLLPEACLPLISRIGLRIDHHASATSFTDNELVDATAGACGEILYDVLMVLGIRLDSAMAEALYTAISTDTGCFRYANTTAHTFTVAAACASTEARLYRINQLLFDTNSYAKLRLQGWMAENTRLIAGGRVAVCALPLQVEQQLGVTEDDMENVSGFPRSIEGVCMAATLRENSDGTVKISVRAIPGYDAAAVCEKFGGGGHKGAAGAGVVVSLRKAAELVENLLCEQVEAGTAEESV